MVIDAIYFLLFESNFLLLFTSGLLFLLGLRGALIQQSNLFIILLNIEIIIIACVINYFFILEYQIYNTADFGHLILAVLFITYIVETNFVLFVFIESFLLRFFPMVINDTVKRERVKPLLLRNNKKNYFIIIAQYKRRKKLTQYYYSKTRVYKKINSSLKRYPVRLLGGIGGINGLKQNFKFSDFYLKFYHKNVTLPKNKKLELLFFIFYTLLTVVVIVIILLFGVSIYLLLLCFLFIIVAAITPTIFFYN